MTKPAALQLTYPTLDQFWRAYQAMERPTELVARDDQTTS